MMNTSPHRIIRSGFTLIELAIVLIVMGLVLGGIWVAAAKTWNHYRVSRAVEELTRVSQGIREYYISINQLPSGDITVALDANSVLPVDMRRSAGILDNPFNNIIANGSFHVIGNPTVSGNVIAGFRISMRGLASDACAEILQAVPVNDADLGIVQVGAQGMAPATSTTIVNNPVSPATAAGWCNQGGTANEADWDFKLRN